MIYILFGHGKYKIIDAIKVGEGRAPNRRRLIRLSINKVIEDGGLSDISFTNHLDGDISYLKDDTFNIEDTDKIINYIFKDMMLDWWKR